MLDDEFDSHDRVTNDNPNIFNAVLALKMSKAEFEKTLLAEPNLYTLVCNGTLAADQVFKMTHEEYEASAISHPGIYRLIWENKMDAHYALSVLKQDILDPISIWNSLTDEKKTEDHVKRYRLYRDYSEMNAARAEMILYIDKKPEKTEKELRQINLLLSRGGMRMQMILSNWNILICAICATQCILMNLLTLKKDSNFCIYA